MLDNSWGKNDELEDNEVTFSCTVACMKGVSNDVVSAGTGSADDVTGGSTDDDNSRVRHQSPDAPIFRHLFYKNYLLYSHETAVCFSNTCPLFAWKFL